MKIAVAGAGYVGLSNAVLLSQHNEVILVDIRLILLIVKNPAFNLMKENAYNF